MVAEAALTPWQAFVTLCAGIITIITVLEKLGIIGKVKEFTKNSDELEDIASDVSEIKTAFDRFAITQEITKGALLALIRNSLYRSFREHREHEMWTDDEASVQTKLHDVYTALGGNGEETIWWEKKKQWRIVSHEEYLRLLREMEKRKQENN